MKSSILGLVAVTCLVAGGTAISCQGAVVGNSNQTLKLREWFGVDHPKQIVEFVLDTPATVGAGALQDENGQPVPFQLLEQGNKLAIQTDLPAHATRVWQWNANGQSSAVASSGVAIKSTAEDWEISNGLLAVRVPKAESIRLSARSAAESSLHPLLDLFNHGQEVPRIYALAPLQGVQLRDGSWTAQGPNVLVALARQLTGAQVDVIERGPFKAVIRLRYAFDKQTYAYGKTKISEAGPSYLMVTVTLFAGQPSLLVEEETDLDEVWATNFYAGLMPNQARYCGHHSTNVRFGREPDGTVYQPSRRAVEPDAIVDLQYEHPQIPSYLTSRNTCRFMAVWDPWIFDGGWYWQLYNASASEDSNLVSIFAGPAERAIGPALSGACVFTLPVWAPATQPVAGISSQSYRRSPDGRVYVRSRFSWGLFVGTKKDLAIPQQVPTVNRQMNLLGGPMTLTKLAAMKFDFPEPARGYGGLYMEKAALDDVIDRARRNKDARDSFYHWLYNAEPSSRPLFDAWVDASGGKMHEAANGIGRLARGLTHDLVYGRGIRSFQFGYWQGGLEMMRRGLWINQVLGSDRLTPEERASVKAAACLFGYVLWDNSFVPMDNSDGFNMGTANMPQQQQGYRYFYALLLAEHPDFVARARLAKENVMRQVGQQINESGAHFGSPHYISAAFAPTLNTLMQVKQLGRTDPFQTEPRLAKFADFYLNLLTPPEVRFPGRPRSYIALGDSSTEASPLYGQLGTAFRDADPALSQKLMGAWQASGRPHSGFFGTTVLAIDDRLPAREPALTSANFPGYYSVLRSGPGTANETAVWVVNGDFYRDHRHNDSGNLVLYALGVPLSVHWGSIYSPQTPGAYMHSSVVLETEIGRPWDQPDPPLNTAVREFWHAGAPGKLTTGSETDVAVSQFVGAGLQWTRTVLLEHSDPALPIVVIRDDFQGSGADTAKVLTLNLLAQGPVETPDGLITPEMRTHPAVEKTTDPNQLPSAGPRFPLHRGISRLVFRGQFGVDFEVFVVAQEAQQALLGNWADRWTQQSVAKWEERQHILRIRGTGSFRVVIVPFRAGQRPADLKLEVGPRNLTVTANGTVHVLIP
jgi:hypothetical protein